MTPSGANQISCVVAEMKAPADTASLSTIGDRLAGKFLQRLHDLKGHVERAARRLHVEHHHVRLVLDGFLQTAPQDIKHRLRNLVAHGQDDTPDRPSSARLPVLRRIGRRAAGCRRPGGRGTTLGSCRMSIRLRRCAQHGQHPQAGWNVVRNFPRDIEVLATLDELGPRRIAPRFARALHDCARIPSVPWRSAAPLVSRRWRDPPAALRPDAKMSLSPPA